MASAARIEGKTLPSLQQPHGDARSATDAAIPFQSEGGGFSLIVVDRPAPLPEGTVMTIEFDLEDDVASSSASSA